MSGEEQRYTLSEASRELRRRECRRGGHTASTVVKDSVGLAVWASCDCGEVQWKPFKERTVPDPC